MTKIKVTPVFFEDFYDEMNMSSKSAHLAMWKQLLPSYDLDINHLVYDLWNEVFIYEISGPNVPKETWSRSIITKNKDGSYDGYLEGIKEEKLGTA